MLQNKTAELHDKDNPDLVPHLKIGYFKWIKHQYITIISKQEKIKQIRDIISRIFTRPTYQANIAVASCIYLCRGRHFSRSEIYLWEVC